MDNQQLGSNNGVVQPPAAPSTPTAAPQFFEVPLGIKILAVLWMIGSGLMVVSAILMVVMGSRLFSLSQSSPEVLPISLLPSITSLLVGVLLAAMGALGFYIARGLRNGKNWARLSLVAFALIGLVTAWYYAIDLGWASAVLPTIINGIILAYLSSSRVRQAFNSSAEPVFTKRFSIVLALIVILTTGMIGLTYASFNQTTKDIQKTINVVAPKSSDDCQTAQSDYLKSNCYLNLATDQNDYSFCEKIDTAYASTRDNCYGREAAATKDLTACSQADAAWLCVSAAAGSFGSFKRSLADCDVFLSPPAALISTLRQQEQELARERSIDNLSSNYEDGDPNFTNIKEGWKQNCVQSIQSKGSDQNKPQE